MKGLGKMAKKGDMSSLARNMNAQQMSKALPPQIRKQIGAMGGLHNLMKQMGLAKDMIDDFCIVLKQSRFYPSAYSEFFSSFLSSVNCCRRSTGNCNNFDSIDLYAMSQFRIDQLGTECPPSLSLDLFSGSKESNPGAPQSSPPSK
ncbi:hypothetical protein Vadar_005811 [Vaccinium darrowii]|uniref:Uncharacterized protein n=1 Tax=Vaccinium darrowii TaxID=229202 RepID=A0ACB7YUB8_9ERIC|nr:hypothetical protein Vadar_005811 [Vaccinium darrowii]